MATKMARLRVNLQKRLYICAGYVDYPKAVNNERMGSGLQVGRWIAALLPQVSFGDGSAELRGSCLE